MPDYAVHKAPWPTELADLVRRARAWPHWYFQLEQGTYDEGEVEGLRLIIIIHHEDSYSGVKRSTAFHYPVPVCTFDRRAWAAWLFDRVMDVWRHEAGEYVRFAYKQDDVEYEERPFAPHHGPGRDPNRADMVGVSPDEQRIRQDGTLLTGTWHSDMLGLHDEDMHRLLCQLQTCRPVRIVT